MRKSTLSEQEIAEFDEFQKKEARNAGLALVPVRDRGVAKLSNGVTVYWHHPKREHEEVNGITTYSTPRVADGKFGIEVDGKLVVFNAEELMKHLRWA